MIKYDILCIGVGGTGTFFLKEFSRYLSGNMPILNKINSLSLCDGDLIEEKNIKRQAFFKEDIGKHKSIVTAEILDYSFNVKWKAYATYITLLKQLNEIFKNAIMPVIIGAVDNHSCRLLCEEYFNKANSCIYIDAANELTNGQCVMSVKYKGKVLGPCRSFYFPDIMYGNLKPVTEMSCEELNNVSPQHILTNMVSSTHLLSNIINLLELNKYKCGVTYFDAFENYSLFKSVDEFDFNILNNSTRLFFNQSGGIKNENNL